MFGVSFTEFLVLGTVALLVLGPEKLPGMLRTLGQWLARLRKLTTEVRYQSGIDEVLRAEGLDGGLNELRGLMRGGIGGTVLSHATAGAQPAYRGGLDSFTPDKTREYPVEGADAYGALPEDLVPGAQPEPTVAAPAAAVAPQVSSGPDTAEAAPESSRAVARLEPSGGGLDESTGAPTAGGSS